MRSQACEPCAKRKVRCDRDEPCSNCKRRKHESCTYAGDSQEHRIAHLEQIIRTLGGDPNSNAASPEETRRVTPAAVPSPASERRPRPREAPKMVQAQNGPVYVESPTWEGWVEQHDGDGADNDGCAVIKPVTFHRDSNNTADAFHTLLGPASESTAPTGCPVAPADASKLWDAFHRSIQPLAMIAFPWTLDRLRAASADAALWPLLSLDERALVLSILFIAAASLNATECDQDLRRPRSVLLADLQSLCEKGLLQAGVFNIQSIATLKALIFYMMAGVERVSLQSLWSLMGLLTRSAQRLGVHRDGELIGLGPTDTEERRRIWWQIQHIDLLLTLRLGLSPFTLTATWDAKLPLNIEDADLQSNPSTAPAERKGLTSFSWCLYTYWLLDQQRSFFRMQMSQGTSSNILNLRPDAFVERLEDGINTKFLQYCDPTRPIDCMLQLSARSLICIFRLRNLHAARPQQDPARHAEYFAACLQLLRYNVALHAQPSLRRFHFWTQQWFPWHAFMYILLELSQASFPDQAADAWALLAELYAVNARLADVDADRKSAQAAESVIAAWKAGQARRATALATPSFVAALEERMRVPDAPSDAATGSAWEEELSVFFERDFEDIDWAFWERVS